MHVDEAPRSDRTDNARLRDLGHDSDESQPSSGDVRGAELELEVRAVARCFARGLARLAEGFPDARQRLRAVGVDASAVLKDKQSERSVANGFST